MNITRWFTVNNPVYERIREDICVDIGFDGLARVEGDEVGMDHNVGDERREAGG